MQSLLKLSRPILDVFRHHRDLIDGDLMANIFRTKRDTDIDRLKQHSPKISFHELWSTSCQKYTSVFVRSQ